MRSRCSSSDSGLGYSRHGSGAFNSQFSNSHSNRLRSPIRRYKSRSRHRYEYEKSRRSHKVSTHRKYHESRHRHRHHRKRSKSPDRHHAQISRGDCLHDRYLVQGTLGEGAFGRVYRCLDETHLSHVALKVIRNERRLREAGRVEIEVLKAITSADPSGKHHCVSLIDSYEWRGHVCLAFPLLGPSLYEYMTTRNYAPMNASHVKIVAYQLCDAIEFLHERGICHTDLKPENVLLEKHDSCNPHDVGITVIDFGSALFDDEERDGIVSTRHYRAPEVVLELEWDYPCDVWSVGTLLAEIAGGETLFQTHDNLEHLAMMEVILGRMPSWMIDKSRKRRYFRHGRLNWDFKERNESNRFIRHHCFPLSERIADSSLCDLIKSMMNYDPYVRITMAESLAHPYFHSLFSNS